MRPVWTRRWWWIAPERPWYYERPVPLPVAAALVAVTGLILVGLFWASL